MSTIYDDLTSGWKIRVVSFEEPCLELGEILGNALVRIAYLCKYREYKIINDHKYYKMNLPDIFDVQPLKKTRTNLMNSLKDKCLVDSLRVGNNYYYRLTEEVYKLGNKYAGVSCNFLECVVESLSILGYGIPGWQNLPSERWNNVLLPGVNISTHTIYVYIIKYIYRVSTDHKVDRYKDMDGALYPLKWHLFYGLLFDANYSSAACKRITRKLTSDEFSKLIIYTLTSFAIYMLEVILRHTARSPKGASTFLSNFMADLDDWEDYLLMVDRIITRDSNLLATNVCDGLYKLNEKYKSILGMEIDIEGFKNDNATKGNYKQSTKKSRADAEKEFWDAELS
tara:strand:- start:583 stop:1602 length:1020 start_codon:yes stop_codon:yes gene_type:complete